MDRLIDGIKIDEYCTLNKYFKNIYITVIFCVNNTKKQAEAFFCTWFAK